MTGTKIEEKKEIMVLPEEKKESVEKPIKDPDKNNEDPKPKNKKPTKKNVKKEEYYGSPAWKKMINKRYKTGEASTDRGFANEDQISKRNGAWEKS